MTYETILLNKENGVATITLNRPPMNPLNSRLFKELYDAADDVDMDPTVKPAPKPLPPEPTSRRWPT